MNIKKILLVLLFPFMAEFLVACCRNCEEVVIKSYSNKAITLSHIDNHANLPAIAMSDSVLKEAYGIRIEMAIEKTAMLFDRSPVFFNTANAFTCRCDEPLQYRPSDNIVDIRIFTMQDFDPEHQAGSDITPYFLLLSNQNFKTIGEYLNERPLIFFAENDEGFSLDLLLMQPPAINKNHQFKVRIILSDNRTLEQETTMIKLY